MVWKPNCFEVIHFLFLRFLSIIGDPDLLTHSLILAVDGMVRFFIRMVKMVVRMVITRIRMVLRTVKIVIGIGIDGNCGGTWEPSSQKQYGFSESFWDFEKLKKGNSKMFLQFLGLMLSYANLHEHLRLFFLFLANISHN